LSAHWTELPAVAEGRWALAQALRQWKSYADEIAACEQKHYLGDGNELEDKFYARAKAALEGLEAAADDSAKASDVDSDRVRLQRMVRELLRLVGLQNKWAMAKTEEVLAATEAEKVECRVRQLRLTADINEVMAWVEKLSNDSSSATKASREEAP
jgi:hypothetical protein